jgi:hypothetical protein
VPGPQRASVDSEPTATAARRVIVTRVPERHPADSRDLPVVGGAPTQAPVTQVLDVLIATNGRSHEASDQDYDLHAPVAAAHPFDLGHGVRIERLSVDDAELVMNACGPRGHYFILKRQFGQRYSYIYEPSEAAWHQNPYGWDPEERINAAMHLSRLVKDNSDSMEFAARIYTHEDGGRQVVPRHDCELGRAYSLRTGRDWLDVDEATQLRALLDTYWSIADELPDRVVRALRRTSSLVTERWVDDRLTEITVALESLVNAGSARVSRQFKDRVTALGAELQVPDVTRSWAQKMYNARSSGLHGGRVQLFETTGPARTQAVEYVIRLEDVLRRAVRHCIEDPDFRARFADDAAVMAWCPVPEPDDGFLNWLWRWLPRAR